MEIEMKKKKIFLYIIPLLVFALCTIYLRDNVLDKIYRYRLWGLNRVPEIEKVHDIYEWESALEFFGVLWVEYDKTYLKDNVQIHIYFLSDEERDYIDINETVSLTDKVELHLNSSYDYSQKVWEYDSIYIVEEKEGKSEHYTDEGSVNRYLQEYNITREEVMGYRKYALYDVVVRTWVEANGGIYWLEKLKLENCTVDNTFQF